MQTSKLIYIVLVIGALINSGACTGRKDDTFKTGRDDLKLGKKASDDSVSTADKPAFGTDPASEHALRLLAMEGNIARVEKLILSYVDVNSSDEDGRTALMLASFNGHSGVIGTLINAGAEVNSTDESGRTALMYASTGPYPDAVRLLLGKGADPNIVDKEDRFSSLMFAASEGQLEVVKILLAHKADPTLKDKDGDTAESFARQNGHDKVAGHLSELYR